MPQYSILNSIGYAYNEFGIKDEADSLSGLITKKNLANVYESGFFLGRDDYSRPKDSLAARANTAIVDPSFYSDIRLSDSVKVIWSTPATYSDQESIRVGSVAKPPDRNKYSLFSEIYSVYIEHLEPGWDGYDAIPISERTIDNALNLARLLPDGLPLPEVIPEPTGEIALEWYRDKTHVFIISIGDNNIVSYAGLFGKHIQAHGTEYIDDHIPQALLNHISRLSI